MRCSVLVAAVLLALAAGAFAEEIGSAELRDLTQSAAQGNPAAQYELGVVYANGDGVAADYGQAAHWFAEAARNGHVEARRQLAFITQMGLAASSAAGTPVTAAPAAASTDDSTFRVQVASVPSEADGAREWHRLQRLHPEALGSLSMAVEAFNSPTGDHLFRVEGGPLDEDGARTVCGKLRAEGAGCRIVRPGP